MIERTVFQCEHCKDNTRTPKIYFSRDRMHAHEANCFYNARNKTCFTCVHKTRKINSAGYAIGCMLEDRDFSKCISFSDCVKRDCERWKLRKEE